MSLCTTPSEAQSRHVRSRHCILRVSVYKFTKKPSKASLKREPRHLVERSFVLFTNDKKDSTFCFPKGFREQIGCLCGKVSSRTGSESDLDLRCAQWRKSAHSDSVCYWVQGFTIYIVKGKCLLKTCIWQTRYRKLSGDSPLRKVTIKISCGNRLQNIILTN